MKCPKCQFEHEWYYYDHKTKKDVSSGDVPALLRVARAAQKIKEHGHHWSVDAQTSILHIPPDEIREFRSALKEVEHLL